MSKTLFLGDEAVAQAALDAGLSGVYAYPGTPSTEITEFIQNSKQGREGQVHSIWAGNEKTAMESAIGMSYAGKRAMVCMKHVGLNVAADPFMNSSITGANGGLVVVVADDPSMHSSQDEQDSRYYAKFALIPSFEPSNQQEAYDITYAAFDYSEKFRTPVLIRLTTRLSHSRAGVERREARPQNPLHIEENPNDNIKELRHRKSMNVWIKRRYQALRLKRSYDDWCRVIRNDIHRMDDAVGKIKRKLWESLCPKYKNAYYYCLLQLIYLPCRLSEFYKG